MVTPKDLFAKLNRAFGENGKFAFASTFIIGLLTHMSVLTSDIPNHDGLDSMYFNQNMITSGRWFLGTVCGISSFYSIPWLIGLLSLIYIALTAVILIKLLRVESKICGVLIGAMLVTFPSLASNFAYVFTMDGYMIGLLLAVLSVYLVEMGRLGFAFGGIALAFSMGIYQSYLPIAMLLCLYKVVMLCFENREIQGKAKSILKYLYMGVIGVALYYLILQVLLKLEGKVLDTYQGINGMADTGIDILGSVKAMYADFITFSLKGNIVFANPIALAFTILLGVAFIAALIYRLIKGKMYKSVWTYVCGIVVILLIPIFTNVILIISPDVTYHLLMRYQWAFFGIMTLAFVDDTIQKCGYEGKLICLVEWITVISAVVITFSYSISDNIAYSNLEKKYEKTYAYCLRLADRIEQTEGYYQGIPIYMIGVVGDDNFPVTDITGDVTGHMLGISGDYLLYTFKNYELFYKYYMGITFNFIPPSEGNYYDDPEYIAMPSFPGEGSTKVVNGVLFVKTENMH